MRTVLNFCEEHHVLISFSPQSVNNWPHYDLLTAQDYRDFIQHLIDRKRAGAPILGSLVYFKMLHDFTPYACYPLLVPRVMPNGDLIYPCRPIELSGTTRGGRPCNLLDVNSWDEAIRLALHEYDDPPQTCAQLLPTMLCGSVAAAISPSVPIERTPLRAIAARRGVEACAGLPDE